MSPETLANLWAFVPSLTLLAIAILAGFKGYRRTAILFGLLFAVSLLYIAGLMWLSVFLNQRD